MEDGEDGAVVRSGGGDGAAVVGRSRSNGPRANSVNNECTDVGTGGGGGETARVGRNALVGGAEKLNAPVTADGEYMNVAGGGVGARGGGGRKCAGSGTIGGE